MKEIVRALFIASCVASCQPGPSADEPAGGESQSAEGQECIGILLLLGSLGCPGHQGRRRDGSPMRRPQLTQILSVQEGLDVPDELGKIAKGKRQGHRGFLGGNQQWPIGRRP